MALFIGSFENKIDRKGRVSVPASFRALFAGEKFNGVIGFPAPNEPCIEVFSQSGLQRMADAAEQSPLFTHERKRLARLFKRCREMAFYGDGRIMLESSLAAHAGITDSALFVSAIDHFQIWQPETHAERERLADEQEANEEPLALYLKPSNSGPFGSGPADGR